MSKHTMGPWRIAGQDASGDNIILGPNDGGGHGRRICAVECRYDIEGKRTKSTVEVSQANAKLIAAAPELLEALKQIDHATKTEADIRALVTKIHGWAWSAIAKAEGTHD